jgi:hypothetical protein
VREVQSGGGVKIVVRVPSGEYGRSIDKTVTISGAGEVLVAAACWC